MRFTAGVTTLSTLLGAVSGACLAIMSVIIFADVGRRYLFNDPLVWAFETCEYLLAVAALFSFAPAFLKDRHLRIEIFVEKLPRRVQWWNRLGMLAIATAFTAVWAWQSWVFLAESYRLQRLSQVLRFPQWIPQIALLVGTLALFLCVLVVTVNYWRTSGVGDPEEPR
jgi:TRAP-type C4-dicarboxylate transport system permease small subunit